MKNKKDINIFLVDDHSLFREGIKYLLSSIGYVNVIGEASDGEELLKLIADFGVPDLIFSDINMPVMDGVESCALANKKYPGIKIIALSMNDDQDYYYKMIKAGAKGFVLKSSNKETLVEAISEVMAGGSFFPEEILRNIIFKFGTEDSVEKAEEKKYGLTSREKEVLSLICQGFKNTEIAEKLFLSPKTIEGHRSNLISKTGTKNAAHLVMFSIKEGIIKV